MGRADALGANSLGAGFDAWFARNVTRQPEQRAPDATDSARESREAKPQEPSAADASATGSDGFSDDRAADRPRQVGLPARLVVGLLISTAVLMWYAIYWLITRQT